MHKILVIHQLIDQVIAALSSRTRGIIGAGYSQSNQIEFVTIASTGDATDFGDDLGNSNGAAGLSDGTRGIFAGSTELSPGNK